MYFLQFAIFYKVLAGRLDCEGRSKPESCLVKLESMMANPKSIVVMLKGFA